MSRIAIVDHCGSMFSVCWALQQEGHDVLFYTEEKNEAQKIGEGLVEHAKTIEAIVKWRPEVAVTYNAADAAARLERADVPTWGSSFAAAQLEEDRMFASGIAKQHQCGRVPRQKRFRNAEAAFAFLEEDGARNQWVFKAEGRPNVSTTHPADSEEQLRAYISYEESQGAKGFVLQERIYGVEVSVEGWFDYRNGWLAPINSTLERKKLMAGDNGPMTGCMGSVVWPWPQERPKLFRQTLERLAPYLKSIKYVGPLDGNFIIDYKTREPNFLEFTPRFGWDAFEALMVMGGGWGDFFVALGRGEARALPHARRGFGVAVRLHAQAAPNIPLWAPIETDRRIFPKDIWRGDGQLKTVGTSITNGFTAVLEASAMGWTLGQAVAEVYEEVIPLVTVPDMTYRDDIGEQAKEDLELLDKWNYIAQDENAKTPMFAIAIEVESRSEEPDEGFMP